MSKIQPESFADLLDPDFQNHVIDAMKGWCFDKRDAIGAKQAGLVDEDICRPLWAWIDETQDKRKPGNYPDIETAKEFATKAIDIVYILKHKSRPLYPEHIAMLNDAWALFQRSIAYHLHIENSVFVAELPAAVDAAVAAKLPDAVATELPAAVAEEIQQRAEKARQQAEAKKQEGIEKWTNSGVVGSKESRRSRMEVLIMLGKKVLEEENRNEIRSIRSFARKIADKVEKGNFFMKPPREGKKSSNQHLSRFENPRKLKNYIRNILITTS